MANQPPAARPWLRLPKLGRQAPPPPPLPTPAAQPPPQPPRIPVIRPAFAQSFRPATTQPQPPPPPPPARASPSPSPSPSPPPTAASPRTFGISSSRSTSSPRSSTGHSSPTGRQSPSPIKEIHPPSQTTLPPPQLNPPKGETEQKKVLVQETFNKPSSGKRDAPKDGRNARIMTMAGENRGAIMEVGYTSRRNKEGKHTLVSEAMIKDKKGTEKSLNLPMNVYVNSNVQGINSSLLFNCSFTHHDPGVHFSHSKKPIHGDRKGKDRGK